LQEETVPSKRRGFTIPAGLTTLRAALAGGALATLTAALAAGAAALIPVASADGAVSTQTAQNCPAESLSQPFLSWGDPAQYFLAPGGDFVSGGGSWSLSGGAQVVSAASPSGAALALPDGSSATSPTVCVGIDAPDIRFFAANPGSPTDTLQVTVHYVGPLGQPQSAAIGEITATGAWEPTAVDPILVNLLALLPGEQTPVSFTLAPQESGGAWQVDDLYVDPWGRS
jgi:hypothetical protein